MLEMLAEANWERPIYMAITVGNENRINFDKHFVQEGLAYRFTPFNMDELGAKIDTEKMYDNLMNKFKFGGINNPKVYLDENTMRMCYTHRRIFTSLIMELLKEKQNDKALNALLYCEEMIPNQTVPYDFQNGSLQLAEAFYLLGKIEEGDRIASILADKSVEYVTWYLSLTPYAIAVSGREIEYHLSILHANQLLMKEYNKELAEQYDNKLNQLYDIYSTRINLK